MVLILFSGEVAGCYGYLAGKLPAFAIVATILMYQKLGDMVDEWRTPALRSD
jgi:hypothetical protein